MKLQQKRASMEQLQRENTALRKARENQAQLIDELRRDCSRMLRRGQKACQRQGWEKGESTEAWHHAAGQLAGLLELAIEIEKEESARTQERGER